MRESRRGAAPGWADFSSFFEAQYPAVARTAYAILQSKEAAQDVAQEAFIQALSHWKKVAAYDKPGAWVRRVAIRLAVKAARKERMQRSVTEVDAYQELVPEDIDLMRALASISPRQRVAIVLHYFEGRSSTEMAEIMDCSEATARVQLHRGRKRLAALLGDESDVA